jgi:hypothetical protein
MYENFPFPLGKKLQKWLFKPNFDIGSFHIYKLFVY